MPARELAKLLQTNWGVTGVNNPVGIGRASFGKKPGDGLNNVIVNRVLACDAGSLHALPKLSSAMPEQNQLAEWANVAEFVRDLGRQVVQIKNVLPV